MYNNKISIGLVFFLLEYICFECNIYKLQDIFLILCIFDKRSLFDRHLIHRCDIAIKVSVLKVIKFYFLHKYFIFIRKFIWCFCFSLISSFAHKNTPLLSLTSFYHSILVLALSFSLSHICAYLRVYSIHIMYYVYVYVYIYM